MVYPRRLTAAERTSENTGCSKRWPTREGTAAEVCDGVVRGVRNHFKRTGAARRHHLDCNEGLVGGIREAGFLRTFAPQRVAGLRARNPALSIRPVGSSYSPTGAWLCTFQTPLTCPSTGFNALERISPIPSTFYSRHPSARVTTHGSLKSEEESVFFLKCAPAPPTSPVGSSFFTVPPPPRALTGITRNYAQNAQTGACFPCRNITGPQLRRNRNRDICHHAGPRPLLRCRKLASIRKNHCRHLSPKRAKNASRLHKREFVFSDPQSPRNRVRSAESLPTGAIAKAREPIRNCGSTHIVRPIFAHFGVVPPVSPNQFWLVPRRSQLGKVSS